MLNKSPSYLQRVGTTYHFRFAFPKNHCLSGEIKLSLRTGNLPKARKLAATLANETRQFIKGEGAIMSATKKEVRSALAAYLRAKLDLTEQQRIEGVSDPYAAKDIPGISLHGLSGKATVKGYVPGGAVLRLMEVANREQLTNREHYPHEEGQQFTVNDFLASTGLDVTEDTPLYKYVHRELLKLEQAAIKIEQERQYGNYNTPTELSILNAYPAAENPTIEDKEDSKSLSETIEQYITENVSDGNWKPATLKEYKAHLALFEEIMGDCLMSDLNHETTRAFFDKIKKLPSNRKKVAPYRDKSISELLKMDIPDAALVTAKTVNNFMTSLSAFYNWCVPREYMPQDFSKKMRVKINRKASELKDPFTDVELKQIFDDLKSYQADNEQPHRWWIPLIGLYTGARLEEIAQLFVSDVRQENGIWIFDINDEADKHLKNKNSRRVIPVHKCLIDAGFIDYHAKIKGVGETRLFPNLKPLKGKCGHYLSRWFGPYLSGLGIKTTVHNVSFHSFRHTFITKAKHLDVPETYVKQIAGHSAGSITFGRYGKGYDVEKLKGVVDQVVFEL